MPIWWWYCFSFSNLFASDYLVLSVMYLNRCYHVSLVWHISSHLQCCKWIVIEYASLSLICILMQVHLVNLTGLKKKDSVEDRLKYADEIMPEILDSASDPLSVSINSSLLLHVYNVWICFREKKISFLYTLFSWHVCYWNLSINSV